MPYFLRSLLVLGLAVVATQAQAAKVENFVVKCIHREELSNDDIYLAAVRDGQPVGWGENDQQGTSVENPIEMKKNSVLALDDASLAKLKFDTTLQIVVKQKNLTSDEIIGTVNLKPGDRSKLVTFKTKKYEYEVEYIVK